MSAFLFYNMDSLEIIKKAIKLQKPIRFEYNRENKPFGKRFGDPHIIFYHSDTNNLIVHIFQTDGVSDHLEEIPAWRHFLIEFIENVDILHNQEKFDIAEGYDPNSPTYKEIVAKV